MPCTIKDVAREASVSITTVSKILNGNDQDIGKATRERVLEVIDRLQYVRSSSARSLVTKRTNVIGLIIPDISNNYFAELVQAIEVEVRKQGYFVIFCDTFDNVDNENHCMKLLLEQSVDGLIIVPTTASTYQQVMDALLVKKPVVFLDRVFEDAIAQGASQAEKMIGNIWFDNFQGGFLATQHLIDCGHRRIGCITGPLSNKSAQERYRGYQHALEQNGIPYRSELVVEANYRYESGGPAAAELLRHDVTAIFAQNDLMAVSAYAAIEAAGKKVGTDISVVGFDNTEYCEWLAPKLTSIIQPGPEMGVQAGKMIISMIQGKEAEVEKQFAPDIFRRASVSKIG